ncbi:DUF3991 and toprim domain-containing protein [Hydrogenoanaerobacterium sp.]|uniref:DUF3991 and toprim domain-containing protein n=1 Tax=Hydrogenoanaerobacterium sp. TaxID=2953763 RepID=UPI00289C1A63|nr:DUF3991 and toprim domain-containing protein [Hydrogenoanaerobacterium sp.]
MGVYVHFTDEQKYRANNVDLVDFLQRRGEKLIPSGRDKRLASDRSITVRGNEWYDHSAESGGYSIDFVRNFYGLTFPEAVTMLLGGEQGEVYRPTSQKKQESKKPFALPAPHSDMRRVYAYLTKTRLIDREVVSYFARVKLLYESCEKSKDGTKEYHNAVFVGFDENGVPRHAHKRGLYTDGPGFKGNVDSCDPNYSFHHIGTSNRLYVFEAPIDLLSYITLHPQDWKKHSYVALCGVSEYAMMKMLELYPNLNHVVLCLDHDEAGIEASEKYQDLLLAKEISCKRELSMHKDWNEDIKAKHGLTAIPAEEHPQHILRDDICRQLMESGLPAKSGCSADTLSALLIKTRSHLHWGRFSEADDCLREMCLHSMAGAVREYRQMAHSRDLSAVQARLRNGFRTYENRGHLKTRLDLLESDIMSLRGYEHVVSAVEKEKLAECYEHIAAHGLKGTILLEKHRQKMEQNQEMKMSM